jgi:ABC-type transporter Mla MlaB component
VIWITDQPGGCPYTDLVMLTIESLSDGRTTTLVLTGTLAGHDLPALERCWKNARSQGAVQVDLCDVKEIDEAGKGLLARMFADGVCLEVGAHPLV